MIRNLRRLGAFALVLGVAYGCGADRAAAPASPSSQRLTPTVDMPGAGHADGGTALQTSSWSKGDTGTAPTSESGYVAPGPDTVLLLKRTAPLPADISVSALIGPNGGEIKIDQAGGKIAFPAGALSAPTLITMTAKAGWNVAYEFEPHGLQFSAPVKIQQDLKSTFAYKLKDGRSLQGAYFSDLDHSFVDPWKLFASVRDVRAAQADREHNPRIAKFYIFHFSGYLMSSGFKGGFGDMDWDR